MNRFIPAISRSDKAELIAISSRNRERAENIAGRFNIPKAYGSYEKLLTDPDIRAVYIPLPNNLHSCRGLALKFDTIILLHILIHFLIIFPCTPEKDLKTPRQS